MHDDISIRPYFIRAVYQWCVDKGHTPHLLARWHEGNPSAVPPRLISDGKIVFNISPEAVRHFVLDADGAFFTARFLGKTVEVQVPLTDILSIYAREQQSGISFPPLPPAQTAAPAKQPQQQRQTRQPRQTRTRKSAGGDSSHIKIL